MLELHGQTMVFNFFWMPLIGRHQRQGSVLWFEHIPSTKIQLFGPSEQFKEVDRVKHSAGSKISASCRVLNLQTQGSFYADFFWPQTFSRICRSVGLALQHAFWHGRPFCKRLCVVFCVSHW